MIDLLIHLHSENEHELYRQPELMLHLKEASGNSTLIDQPINLLLMQLQTLSEAKPLIQYSFDLARF